MATDAGLSVPYVANLENGRGNPTVDALSRIGQALGTQLTFDFAPDATAGSGSAELSATLVRFSRSARFRRDVRVIAETLDEEPTALAARVLEALARFAQVLGRDLNERDWSRLLDALLLIALHPQPGGEAGAADG
ncbi:helix-turn-helix domain-containing protein [Actinoplanes sp. CA-054009]